MFIAATQRRRHTGLYISVAHVKSHQEDRQVFRILS